MAFVSSSAVRGGWISARAVGVDNDSSTAISSSSATTTTTITEDTDDTTDIVVIPSWENLKSELDSIITTSYEDKQHEQQEQKEQPLLTLYRDTNGWCPFCERVWIAIRAKGLPYQETLVSLQNKPEWYKQMVPTGLVPAVLFHDDGERSRKLVWESKDILYALDKMFPDTPKLMKDNEHDEFRAAMELQDRLQSAGFKFLYGNQTLLTENEKGTLRDNFESILDELDAALGEQQRKISSDDGGGCFRLGKDFSGVDATMIPTLERWRYQLPMTKNLDVTRNRIHLQNWFNHLDSFPPYADRVAGDRYSWTAVTSTFLRYFGSDDPELQSKVQRADDVADGLTKSFVSSLETSNYKDRRPLFAFEAATKLITNHEAVVDDCRDDGTGRESLSQKHIPRASCDRDTVDLLLRYVASILLQIASESSSFSISPRHNINDVVASMIIDGSSDDDEKERRTTQQQGVLALKT